MSTRTVLRPKLVITSGDMSGSITSLVTVLQGLSNLSYDVSWTGTTPIGTLKLQLSNTYALAPDGSVASAGSWTDAPMDVNGAYATTIAISGNTGNGLIEVTLQGGYAVRLVYTRSSGTGTLSATVAGKVS